MTAGTRVRSGLFLAALCVAAALPASASAQEAPQCLTAAEKLDDGVNHWHGTNGKDSVTGLRGKDVLDGRGGNDFINGGRDNDIVKGGPGDDVLCGGRSADKLIGGPGDDIIYGEEENDTIYPGPGDDKVLGSAGDDRIFGYGEVNGQIIDDGLDLLNGGYNDDIIVAGGADTLQGYTHNDTLSTATPDIAPALMDGGGNDDTLYGSEAADIMHGGENGRDKLYGAGGDDQLFGDGNDDEVYGQIGDDDLFGGDGFDFLDGGPGDDSCDGGELRDTATECENEASIERESASPKRGSTAVGLYAPYFGRGLPN
jgi:Ca2+-binding RTX toxin-like protein